MTTVTIHPHVAMAMGDRRPIVALETAVITHGLPRESPNKLPGIRSDEFNVELNDCDPLNLQVGLAMQQAVRDVGAVPAVVAVVDGSLRVGLNEEELRDLALRQDAEKASTANLAHVMTTGGTAGTTVSATLIACTCTRALNLPMIRVFATGGIGGVHPGWTQRPDVSADLRQLSITPVCVVCSGAKSILDLPATLEALETLGVPVIGYRTNHLPRFHCPASGDESLALAQRVDDPAAAGHLCNAHWHELGQMSGCVLANPVPDRFALGGDELDRAVSDANRTADDRNITGAARTPFLLDELTRLTEGRSLRANIALLLSNARLAGEVACAMAD